jgi:hypothetical protein
MTDDAFRTAEEQRIWERDFERRFRNVLRSVYTKTVGIDNSMSASDVEDLIRSNHSNIPYDEAVTLQFADGTYNWVGPLTVPEFGGGGHLVIQGNLADASLGTAKSVFVDVTGDNNAFVITDNECRVTIQCMKVRVETDVSGASCIRSLRQRSFVGIYYNYLLGTDDGLGQGIFSAYDTSTYIYSNYFSDMLYAIRGYGSRVMSNNNDDTGTQPSYGLRAEWAAAIGKNGTQPAGSVANESITDGGIIRA